MLPGYLIRRNGFGMLHSPLEVCDSLFTYSAFSLAVTSVLEPDVSSLTRQSSECTWRAAALLMTGARPLSLAILTQTVKGCSVCGAGPGWSDSYVRAASVEARSPGLDLIRLLKRPGYRHGYVPQG